MANVDIRVGKKDAVFFSANPTLILKDGQFLFNSDTSELFIGDGATQLSALVAINGGSGVQSVTGLNVDDTDPLNPIVNPLGLIKIIDLNGDFFTDLVTANTYISQFTSAPITNESYNNGIYYFTVPKYSDFSNSDNFLSDMFVKTAAIIDEFGLISVYGENLLSNVSSEFDSFFGDVITCGINSFNNFSGTVTLHKIITDYTTFQNTVGTFNINTIILSGSTPTDFFLGSTATISTNKYNLSNANLLQASTNGANVFYEGIDKENLSNKQTNLTPSATKYPTVNAVITGLALKLTIPTATDYSVTSTIVGFASFTTKIIQVIDMGAYDLINFDLAGTSNATIISFTVPNALSASAPAVSTLTHSLSAASNGSGLAQLAIGSTTVNCYFNVSSGAWGAAGTKRVRGTIIVQK